MKNVSNFLALNPAKAVQDIRKELASIIRTLRSTNDISKMELLKTQLNKIKKLGGFEKIVPVEGIVFVYGGNTYKLTGAFAPLNQILGTLKYSKWYLYKTIQETLWVNINYQKMLNINQEKI